MAVKFGSTDLGKGQNIRGRTDSGLVVLPMPGELANKNMVYQFGGVTQTINFSTIFTASDVATVQAMILTIEGWSNPNATRDDLTLDSRASVIAGVFKNFSYDYITGSPLMVRFDFEFIPTDGTNFEVLV